MAPAPVLRRCRFKQPDPHADVVCQLVQASQPQKRRGRPNGPAKNSSGSNRSQKLKDKDANGESHGDEMPDGSGHVDRDGKCSSLSIWRKMQIIKEYERLKALKTIKNIESFMLKNGKMKGGYQGCLSRSKWLGAREKYKWDDFIAHCPELSKKVHEVPNVLLEVLGVAAPCQTFEKSLPRPELRWDDFIVYIYAILCVYIYTLYIYLMVPKLYLFECLSQCET